MAAIVAFFAALPPEYKWPAQFCTIVTAGTWAMSLVTSNVSQVDRLWTFLPTIYTAYFALLPLWPQKPLFPLCPFAPKNVGWIVVRDFSPRAVLMLSLSVIWMFRLSYNTYRRGLFNLKEEDYRWAVLRTQLPPWLFQVVNLTFIAAIQNVLLLGLGVPAQIASTAQPHTPLSTSDYLLAGLALVVLALEFTADNQQYAYHGYKHAATKQVAAPYNAKDHWLGARLNWTPADAKRGFVTRGLWAYSRHPNFACEQSFWWIMNFIPVLAPGSPRLSLENAPITLGPAIALSLLFWSSTPYTEAITSKKYPEYAAYKARVGMFGPLETFAKGVIASVRGNKATLEAKVWGDDITQKKD